MARLCTKMNSHLTDAVLSALHSRGINTTIDLLEEDPERLVQIASLSYKDVIHLRHCIITDFAAFPSSGKDIYNEMMLNSALISTGISSFDTLLDGGLLTGHIYELCGLSGSGKTQMCLTLAAAVAHSFKQQVHYIDAKLDFSGRRVLSLLQKRELQEVEIVETLQRIQVTRIENIYELFSFLYNFKKNLSNESHGKSFTRAMIIDSLPVLFYPFIDDSHNEGISLMHHLASTMKHIATEFHIVFIIVNIASRYMDDASPFTEDTPGNFSSVEALKPALGKHWIHVPSTRLLFQRNDAQVLITILKSTSLRLGQMCTVTISDKGVE